MHAVVHALYVYGVDSVKIGFRSTIQAAHVGNSGVIHQDVNPSLLKYFIENCVNTSVLGDVAAVGLRVRAIGCDFAGNRIGSVLVDVQHTDAGSATGKSLSDRAADAASPSRNHGKFAVEAKRV